MTVKMYSTTHIIMLVLMSSRNRPKTVANLRMITQREPSKIQRALDHLHKHKWVTVSKNERGQSTYCLSAVGKEELVAMAKASSSSKCAMI